MKQHCFHCWVSGAGFSKVKAITYEHECTAGKLEHDQFPTYIFFLAPFLPPLDKPLFFPTAMKCYGTN